MAGLCEGGNEPPGSLKAIKRPEGCRFGYMVRTHRRVKLENPLALQCESCSTFYPYDEAGRGCELARKNRGAEAAQKLNLTSSPHRRKRHSSGEDDGGTGFSAALRRAPPPVPPALLRRIGVKEVTGVGKRRASVKVARITLEIRMGLKLKRVLHGRGGVGSLLGGGHLTCRSRDMTRAHGEILNVVDTVLQEIVQALQICFVESGSDAVDVVLQKVTQALSTMLFSK
ncbi:hypothetical protein ANN_05198 [Periplaneta americana]|uniref:Uncharacterized protein n=1 Tax=Periplaneta americana TaxID=6978 RepID=A0ABQ8TBQ8_PERAM|nr:hypothetical protein ANN_05198 [Periplaneta americana]